MNIIDIIKKRKSVRTYDGRELTENDLNTLKEYAENISNPFDIPVEIRFLNAGEHKLSSPVIIGEKLYAGGKYKKSENGEAAFGYSFEKFILKAEETGVGTVWLAGTIDRKLFEKAMELKEEEIMPAVTPLGYRAKKRSIRESMMRKGIKADERLGFGEIFFKHGFGYSLNEAEAGKLLEPLEMVRLAPSATNKQPWRLIINENIIHFYEKKDKGYEREGVGDIQKVDMGIAMAHFELSCYSIGIHGSWRFDEPGIVKDAGIEYIASYEVND